MAAANDASERISDMRVQIRARAGSWGSVAAALTLAAVVMVLSGIPIDQSLRVTAIVAVQVAAGAYWWSVACCGRRPSFVESLGMGIGIGTSLSMVCSAALWASPLGPIGWCLPAVMAVLTALVRRLRGARAVPRPNGLAIDVPQAVGLAVGLAGGLLALAVNWARAPLAWGQAARTLHPDMLFFEALSKSMAMFGPHDSIFSAGTGIRYHWFTFFWAGDVARLAGLDTFAAMTRILPLVSLVGAAAIASSWSRRLSDVRWVPALAALLVVVGGYLGAQFGAILNFDSPSQALTAVWMLAASIVVIDLIAGALTWPSLALLLPLAAATMGGKVSQAAVLGAGTTVAAAGIWLWVPRLRRRAVAVVAVVFLGTVVAYLLVISGINAEGNLAAGGLVNKASAMQGLDPGEGGLAVAAGTITLLVAVLARSAGVTWLIADGTMRKRPETLFVVGALGAGAVALVALSQGVNDLWFILAASGPAAVLSAVGAGRGWRRYRPPRPRLALAACIGGGAAMAAVSLAVPRMIEAPVGMFAAVWLALLAGAMCAVLACFLAEGRARYGSVLALGTVVILTGCVFARVSSVGTVDRLPEPGDESTGPVNAVIGEPIDHRTLPERRAVEEEAAAAWVRSRTDTSSIGATNLVNTPVVPALTGRRMLAASLPNLDGFGTPADQPMIVERARISDGLSTGLSPSIEGVLCLAGVDWIWLEDAQIRSEAVALQLYERAWMSGDVEVLVRNSRACPIGA